MWCRMSVNNKATGAIILLLCDGMWCNGLGSDPTWQRRKIWRASSVGSVLGLGSSVERDAVE